MSDTVPSRVESAALAAKLHVPKAISLCTIAAGLIDLLKPLGPIAMYSLIASALVLVVLVPLARLFKGLKTELRTVQVAAGLVMVASLGLLVAQQMNPAFAERGIIASTLPEAAQVQKQLFGMHDTLKAIEKSSRDSATSLDTLQQSVKKETSADPRKELINLGVPWKWESFVAATRQGDVRILKLLLESGMRPQPRMEFALRFIGDIPADVDALFQSYKLFDVDESECPRLDDREYGQPYWFYKQAVESPRTARFVKTICAKPDILKSIDDALAAERERLRDREERNANRARYIGACVADIKSKYSVEAMWRYVLFEGGGNYIPSNGFGQTKVTAEMLIGSLMWKASYRTPDNPASRREAYESAIAQGCAEHNPVLTVSHNFENGLRTLREQMKS